MLLGITVEADFTGVDPQGFGEYADRVPLGIEHAPDLDVADGRLGEFDVLALRGGCVFTELFELFLGELLFVAPLSETLLLHDE